MRQRKEKPNSIPTHSKTPLSTNWDRIAQWYDELVGEQGSEYHRHVVLPGAIRLMGLKPGLKALDVACGQGVFCRILHRSGIQATGVDDAKKLIHLARERSDKAIQFHAGDARDLSFLPAESFHAAACILAIQNIYPLPPVFASVAGRLVPNGRLVIVMMHPCFRGPKFTSWGWDEAGKVQYRRVDRYLIPRKEPIYTHPGSKPSEYTWSFHRPIEDYVKTLRNAGFMIDAMEEWPSHKSSEAGPRGAAENLSRKEIPMFLAIRAVKVAIPKEPTGLPTP